MATGELPFQGKTTMAVLNALASKRPKPPIDINPNLPRALSNLILQLLQKNPSARPKTARIVVAALAEVLDAPADYEEVEEEPEFVEKSSSEPGVVVLPDPVLLHPRPKPKRRGTKRKKESDEEALERKVIKLAIFAGIFVILLLLFLVVKKKFFPPQDADVKPQTRFAEPWFGQLVPLRDDRAAITLLS